MDENVGINIFTFFETLVRIFMFLFNNNQSISVYCLGIYKINGFIKVGNGLELT